MHFELDKGQLGIGNTTDVDDASLATTVNLGTGFEATEIVCGSHFCCAVSKVQNELVGSP